MLFYTSVNLVLPTLIVHFFQALMHIWCCSDSLVLAHLSFLLLQDLQYQWTKWCAQLRGSLEVSSNITIAYPWRINPIWHCQLVVAFGDAFRNWTWQVAFMNKRSNYEHDFLRFLDIFWPWFSGIFMLLTKMNTLLHSILFNSSFGTFFTEEWDLVWSLYHTLGL